MMMIDAIKELKTLRAALLEEASAIRNKAKSEDRLTTEDENQRFDSIMAQIDALDIGIHNSDQPGAYKGGRKSPPDSGMPLGWTYETHGGPTGVPAARITRTGGGKRYAEMFPHLRMDKGGFRDLEDYFATLHAGLSDPRLNFEASLKGGSGPEGGYAVPIQFAAMILDKSLEAELVRPRATVWPMETNERRVPSWNGSAHSSSLFGGLTASWTAESTNITESAPTLRKITLKVNKLGVYTKASNELIADGGTFEQMLGDALIQSVAWNLDHSFFRGTGAGQPLGILNDPGLVVIAKETGQANGTIVYKNLVNILARLHPMCFANSEWYCSSTCIPELLNLSVPIGTGGAHVPALLNENGKFSLLTRPVNFTEKLPSLGAEGDIVLADLSQYYIGLRADVSLEKSQHVGFQSDETAYRCLIRADGQGSWDAPITPKNGETLSWCVALGARP